MDLYCNELTEDGNRAYEDPVLLEERTLKQLLVVEDRYVAVSTGRVFQNEITNPMRNTVAEWMWEVCDEQDCPDQVFLLAMNLFNRFLLLCSIRKTQLQLLGTACMLIASKLVQPKPFPIGLLVSYTDYSITAETLMRWEMLVISTLKWDVAAITPQDFLVHLLGRLPLAGIEPDKAHNHSKTLIACCVREAEFAKCYPSIIACACIASALEGLGWCTRTHRDIDGLFGELHGITSIEKDYIRLCFIQVEQMIRRMEECNGVETRPAEDSPKNRRPDEFTPPPDKLSERKVAFTPTDVQDVHF